MHSVNSQSTLNSPPNSPRDSRTSHSTLGSMTINSASPVEKKTSVIGYQNSTSWGASTSSMFAETNMLLEHSKSFVLQLQSLAGTKMDMSFNGRIPPYGELVEKISEFFAHQQQINRVQAKILTVNYIVNLTNFAKNHQLQKVINHGRQQIAQLQSTIENLEDGIQTLNTDVDTQRNTAERMKISLETTRCLLETSMIEVQRGADFNQGPD
ncbi:hypothetical protein HK098_000177 [Nowakowskiella sp. JEL0407]|nr:hypothetical protein HK098_000177 [Nowakowskiella sp. JEL0407]